MAAWRRASARGQAWPSRRAHRGMPRRRGGVLVGAWLDGEEASSPRRVPHREEASSLGCVCNGDLDLDQNKRRSTRETHAGPESNDYTIGAWKSFLCVLGTCAQSKTSLLLGWRECTFSATWADGATN
jgi:hypothetical protein